ncbi:protein TIME FOR COFFEE isoform X1 [Musa acuminata AAA Group]|uniref:protein TIME FOR COFFEE isoform X1 n=1 Tax=Musa acuminata AAA Group TaxID=214697 RepID=UPI0031DD7647
MERHREARRGSMAAATANGGGGGGGGLSRRRQRNSSGFRDSPEEDGRMEMPETSRLRDRGAKKDRDRDRSSRSKRRRGERTLHGSNRDRDEADESSEESIDQDEDDEDEDLSVPVRLQPSSPSLVNQAAASSPQHNHQINHHHQQQLPRKSFPPKVVKWKPDEMIGFTVPRKARSAASKRSHETSGLGGAGGGGGGGDQITRQASISPSRLSPASTTQLSPSSSNGSLRKKMKQVSGAKIRPPKISKSTSLSHDEIEMEVAEVLYGMTRQFECLPKHDGHKVDSRDVDGGSGNEAKSRVPSTNSLSPSPVAYPSALPSSNSCSNPAPFAAIAPKRKKPRPVKFDEESPTSPVGVQHLSSLSVPFVAKIDSENQTKTEASSPRSEKNSASAAIKIGGESVDVLVSQALLSDVQQQQESAKTKKGKTQELHTSTGGSNNGDKVESKEELVPRAKGSACGGLDVNICDTEARKMAPDSPKEEMFKIDLMAPPPGKLSPERGDFNDFDPDHKPQGPDKETALKPNNKDKTEEKPAESTVTRDEQQTEKSVQREIDSRKQVVIKQTLDLQLDLEKPKKDDSGIDKVQVQKQQAKDPKVEPKQEKSGSTPSLQMPLTVGTWPGGFPPYGYMGQVPSLHAVVPMDGSAGPSSSLQPPAFLQTHPRPKRCATHCYIAQMISNHQKFARMNCFWTAAAGAAPLYGTKPYNPNIAPPSDASTPGNPTQGSFLGANMGTLQEAKGSPALASYMGSTSQEKMLSSSNTIMESAQRKPLIFQQVPHSAAANNMLHGPAFIFPINQQQATAAAANRAGGAKSTPGSAAEVRASGAMSSAVGSCGGGGTANPVNLSFASLPPNEAQYVAFVQNNMYPFPAHISGATAFRGTSNAQAMPFFYPPHMLHPSQLRPQQQQPPAGPLPHVQPSHHNPGNLSGSSQKHPQQLHGIKGSVSVANANGCPATNHRQDHLPQHSRPMECKGMEDDLPTTDAAIAMGNGGGHGDKQPVYQQKQNLKVELAPPQAFAIPFASFGGAGTATPGLDFSSMVQNHAILQSLPENSRHGYHQMTTAAVAATTQAAEKKKVHQVSEDVKSVARELNTNMVGEEDRKIMVASKGLQHSFSFEKADNEPPISSVLSNSGVDVSARSVNLIHTSANGSRSTDRASGTATATTAAIIAAASQQPQQHLIHLQKQQLQMQHQLASTRSKPSASSNNTNMHPESLPGGCTGTKFPRALTGFPQAFVQGGSPIQRPQGKTSSGRLVDPAAAPPLVKNNVLQLQGRASQQPFPAQNHQTQISFGVNSNKMVAPGGQHLSGVCRSPSPSSSSVAVGSPSNSVNKNASGSPSASASVKPSPQTSAIVLPQQSAVKQSASSSSSKSTTASNSNMPSILGHPQKVPAPSSNTKQQQQPQQSKQQPFSEAQIFFSNPHLQQVQCAQSSAAPTAAQYYQKRQSEQQMRQSQQQQQQSSAPSSAGMLSLCAPSALTLAGVPTTSDPAKALAAASVAAANSIKGLPPPGYYNAAQLAVAAQSASGSPRPPISATFPYMSLPPFTMKPSSEQKPAAGSDNLHACWQPEKR